MQEICRCGQELHGNARYERFFGAQAGLAGLLRRLEDRRLPHARVGRGQRRDAGSRHLLPLLREMRDLTVLTQRYYDRSYHKHERYTL